MNVNNIRYSCLGKEISFKRKGSLVSAVDKISAFQSQGPGLDSRLCLNLDICATFFYTKLHSSAFHPYEIGK